jgi:hypothetical protein
MQFSYPTVSSTPSGQNIIHSTLLSHTLKFILHDKEDFMQYIFLGIRNEFHKPCHMYF